MRTWRVQLGVMATDLDAVRMNAEILGAATEPSLTGSLTIDVEAESADEATAEVLRAAAARLNA